MPEPIMAAYDDLKEEEAQWQPIVPTGVHHLPFSIAMGLSKCAIYYFAMTGLMEGLGHIHVLLWESMLSGLNRGDKIPSQSIYWC